MTDRYPRRRNRLRYPGYDYAQPSAVFVTLCTFARQSLFGTVDRGQTVLNPAGEAIRDTWRRITDTYREIEIDALIVMPDHVHGDVFMGIEPEAGDGAATVGDVVRWFKAVTVWAYRDGGVAKRWEPYERHLWQDTFHDRIIRSAAELETVRAYIVGNPGRWCERQEAEWTEPIVFRHRASAEGDATHP